eukprot:1448498-Pyramimonas_sp.AAC.1
MLYEHLVQTPKGPQNILWWTSRRARTPRHCLSEDSDSQHLPPRARRRARACRPRAATRAGALRAQA